jgi:hypothetical protein
MVQLWQMDGALALRRLTWVVFITVEMVSRIICVIITIIIFISNAFETIFKALRVSMLVLTAQNTVVIANLVFLLFASVDRIDIHDPLEIRIWLAYSIVHIFTFWI